MSKKKAEGLGVIAIALFDIAGALDRLASVEAMRLEQQRPKGTGYSFLDKLEQSAPRYTFHAKIDPNGGENK